MLHPLRIAQTVLALAVFASIITASVHADVYEVEGKKHSWFSFNKPKKANPSDQMEYAQGLLKKNKTKKASKAFHALVTTWPGSAEAPMAQWAYAKVLDARGKKYDAFDQYQVLIENYTGRFPDYEKAVARQFVIATNIMITKRGGFLLFGGFEAPERAIPYLEKVVQNGPRTAFAPEAQYLIAKAYEDSFEYDLAVVSYITTLHRYPLNPLAEKAAFGRARSLKAISDNYPNSEEALEDAWAGIMVFLRAFPHSEHTDDAIEIRDQILERKAKKSYDIAVFYDKKAKRPKAALESYENFVQQYPKSRWTDTARQRMITLSQKIDVSKEEAADENN